MSAAAPKLTLGGDIDPEVNVTGATTQAQTSPPGAVAPGPEPAPHRGAPFSNPLTLLVAGVLVAAALTWVLPAGEFTRVVNAGTGRSVVVPGSFHRVEAQPVGPFEALVALPRGMVDAADIVFLVFLVGGAFYVVDRTGALRWGLETLLLSLGRREMLVIPLSCLAFGTGGVLYNMHEEIVALVPVLLFVTARLRVDRLVAVGMSFGAAVVGSAFSPMNPFQVGIAQRIAELPLLSGAGYRIVFLAAAIGLWTAAVMRYAARTRTAPDALAAPVSGTAAPAAAARVAEVSSPAGPVLPGTSLRHTLILATVAATFAVYVWGMLRLEWGFHEMSGLFFLMGVMAGLVGGLGVDRTASAFVAGFREMAFAALLIGVARAIFVVLSDGRIVDTVVHGLFQPVEGLAPAAAAVAMMLVQAAVHVPVPSVSGQAVLTLPILVPLSDLLGLSRQLTVLAYQYGGGLGDFLTPTNGALMAVLASAGVRYDRWMRFVLPVWGALLVLGSVALVVGVAVGWR